MWMRRHHHRRIILVMLLWLALLPLMTSAAPVEVWHYKVVTIAPPDPGPGWGTVSQLLTGSGCDGTSCGSSWRPRNDSYTILLEKSSDRITLGHGSGDGSPPYNATVVFRRQTCPTDGAWAGGTWHHNFQAKSRLEQTEFRVVQLGGQTVYFITLTQRWSSGYFQSFAHNDPCLSADPVTPTPTSPIGSGNDPTPPPVTPLPGRQVRVSVSVTVSGTPPTPGSASGTGGGIYTPGASVRATADYPSSWDDDATWGGISYSGCGQDGSDWQVTFDAPGSDCTLVFTIRFSAGSPGATPSPNPCTGGGSLIPEPSYSLWTPIDLATSSPGPVFTSTVMLTFQQIPTGFGSDLKAWKEQFISLEGLVNGRLVWEYDEGTDHGGVVRELRNNDRRRISFTRPIPGSFRLLWSGNPGQPMIQFTSALDNLPPGEYRIISNTRNIACTPRFREQTFYFQVGDPTPPPIPSVGLFGWARSPHDGASSPFYTTKNNPNPAHFSWSYGGIVEFYPDVALTLPAASGYRITTTITGWHFRGSPPLDSMPVDRRLAYREPVRILWSKYPPPELHAPEVDTYRIARVDTPVAIAVTVDYTYQVSDAAGVPIGPPLSGSVEGQFTVSLVYTQVLDGGRP